MPDRAGRTGHAAAGDGGFHVKLLGRLGGGERLTDDELQSLETEVLVQRAAVDGDAAAAVGDEVDTGGGGFPTAGAVSVGTLALLGSQAKISSFPYSAVQASGFCAAFSCSAPL